MNHAWRPIAQRLVRLLLIVERQHRAVSFIVCHIDSDMSCFDTPVRSVDDFKGKGPVSKADLVAGPG
jgi:hypothetical protein